MAASRRKFRIEDFWPHAVRRVGRDVTSTTLLIPYRSLDHHRRSCENWLLPPEKPQGLDAVIQAVSMTAGPVLLLIVMAGGVWLAIG